MDTPKASTMPPAFNLEEAIKQLGPVRVNQLSVLLSPDGKWLAGIKMKGNSDILRIVSTSDPAQALESEYLPEVGNYLQIEEWSPDSSAITVFSGPEGAEGCPETRLVIYELAQRLANPKILGLYTGEAMTCLQATWSPDSSDLAVGFNGNEILIVDRQARIQSRIIPTLKEHASIGCCSWQKGRLFYKTFDDHDPENSIYGLAQIALPFTGSTKNLYTTRNRHLDVLGQDPSSSRLLLYEADFSYPPSPSFLLRIFDVDSQVAEQDINVPGQYVSSSVAPATGFVAVMTKNNSTPNGSRLLIFDWNTSKLISYGEINDLIGWRSIVNGFLVVRAGPDNNLQTQVIRP